MEVGSVEWKVRVEVTFQFRVGFVFFSYLQCPFAKGTVTGAVDSLAYTAVICIVESVVMFV